MEHESALREAADEFRSTHDAYETARQKLAEKIRAARAAGMRQADILRATKHVYTREQVRKICLPE